MVKTRISLALTLFLAGSLAFAQDFDAKAFKATYDVAMKSDGKAIREAIKNLDEAFARNPPSPEALIFKGSLYAKLADIDFWFWDKLSHVNKGIDLKAKGMDRLDGSAGQSVPEERKIVMYAVRGITSALIPASFKQAPVAIYEMERAKNHKYFPEVDADVRAQILGLLSRLYRNSGRQELAATDLEAAIAIDPVVAEKAARN